VNKHYSFIHQHPPTFTNQGISLEMKLTLLLFLSSCVASRIHHKEKTSHGQIEHLDKDTDLSEGSRNLKKRPSSQAEPSLVGPPNRGLESTTSTARQAIADFDGLIDLGRNLNAKNLSALKTLKAFESLEALGNVLRNPPDSLKALKAFESPEMLKEALKEALETNPKLSTIPEFLNALADLRAFDSFGDLDAALNFLQAIKDSDVFESPETIKDALERPETLNFRKARDSLRFFKSSENGKAFKTLESYKRARTSPQSLGILVKILKFIKALKAFESPKDLESHESVTAPESAEILKAYTEALEFIKSYKNALGSSDPTASLNALKSPEALEALELPKALESPEAIKALKALDSPEAHEAFEFLKVFDSPEALGAFEFLKTLKNALEAPEALSEALEFLKTRKAHDSQEARESLGALNSLLARRRALAGDNPDLVAEHENTASIIMTECPALADAEIAVQSALQNQYYEVLRCLQRHPIWEDKSQEHWYWAMIYETPAWNKVIFNERVFEWSRFGEMFFKIDDAEHFEQVSHEPYFKDISKDDICKNIIKFDAVNILTVLYPAMIKEVAENVDLMVEYGPSRLINQLIPPHTVKSAKQLQILFDSGYDQIPKRCLRLKNGVPTIHTDCARLLAESNCLSLIKEMFQHNPDFKYDSNKLYDTAIMYGSLDVAKWPHGEEGMQCPEKCAVTAATQRGHLEVIEWIFAEFINQIDWKAVIEESYNYWRSHKVIDYLEDEVNVTLEPKVALYRLAAKGDLTGLQTVLSKSPDNFLWQDVADGAESYPVI
jgi:hypothetical protein